MKSRDIRRSPWLAALILSSSLFSSVTAATVVQFQTVMGDFEVNLYDNTTPQTVANFLSYVSNLAYTNSVIHRSAAGFVIQGGGFTFDNALPLSGIPANAPVMNEPEFSNVAGTIAMAKLGGDPNSATSQWFFNLVDNSANLDGQNGGFTVFGEVVGSGMDVVNAIAALPTFNFGAPLDVLPLTNYTATDFNNNVDLDDTNLVIITAIDVSDPNLDSAAGLNPPVNNANTGTPPPVAVPAPSGGSGGGGAFNLLLSLLLAGFITGRRI